MALFAKVLKLSVHVLFSLFLSIGKYAAELQALHDFASGKIR